MMTTNQKGKIKSSRNQTNYLGGLMAVAVALSGVPLRPPSILHFGSPEVEGLSMVSTASSAKPPFLPSAKAESHRAASPVNRQRLRELCADARLSFEANFGQTDPKVSFITRLNGYTLFLTATELVFKLRDDQIVASSAQRNFPQAAIRSRQSTVLRMALAAAQSTPRITGLNQLPLKCNYFIGNDPKRWRTDVPTYSAVKYEDVYPGIDVIYYRNAEHLEYDFFLEPGADPGKIVFSFDGADRITLGASGDLLLKTASGEIRQHKPIVHQQRAGFRHEIPARYVMKDKTRVGVEVGEYDKSLPLVIDPVLSYSTYVGGSGDDLANGIAVDSAGNVYITGRTSSTDFPTTPGAFHTVGGGDAFVTRLNPDNGTVVYSTYLGGTGLDEGFGIAVDPSGNAYITGDTTSVNFPTTEGSFQTAEPGIRSAFVAKLNSSGSTLSYSTYLGGTDTFIQRDGARNFANAISVDSFGNAYVVGSTDSNNFPTANALQPAYNGGICGTDARFACLVAFVVKLNSIGTSLVFSTYLGGSSIAGRGGNVGRGVAVDGEGNVYVVGATSSTSFPTANPLQPTLAGSADAFVTKLNPSGDAFIYSTYLGGGNDDVGSSVAVDAEGNAYITGNTMSADFPTANPFQSKGGCATGTVSAACNDAFAAKLDSTGSALVYSTYLGGADGDAGVGIAVNAGGTVYVTGQTFSKDFPTKNAVQSKKRGDSTTSDAFISKLDSSGSALVYSTYLGGKQNDTALSVAIDSFGNAYVTGNTSSTGLPTVNSFQRDFGGGGSDAFVVKIAVPRIISASVQGKRLFVIGEGFDDCAVILINGEEQKTRNDEEQPTTLLIGKKAGKRIVPGQTVILQVRGADGTLSNEFPFTRPVELLIMTKHTEGRSLHRYCTRASTMSLWIKHRRGTIITMEDG